jgi:hypothetical protein
MMPRAAIALAATVGPSVRHRFLNGGTQRPQIDRQIVGGQCSLQRHHAATDVDPYGCRNDRALGRYDAAHCGANAPVYIRHCRNPLVDKRQRSHIAQLLLGGGFDGNALGPGFDGHALFRLDQIVALLAHA